MDKAAFEKATSFEDDPSFENAFFFLQKATSFEKAFFPPKATSFEEGPSFEAFFQKPTAIEKITSFEKAYL